MTKLNNNNLGPKSNGYMYLILILPVYFLLFFILIVVIPSYVVNMFIMINIFVIFLIYLGSLIKKNRGLEKINTDLNKKIKSTESDYYISSKLLIRRDIELTRSNEQLRRLDQVKSEFVSVAAHQLRTPLTGIKWTLDLFLKGDFGKLTPEQNSFLSKAQDSNNHMITIINDMLRADRIESGKFKFNKTNVQIEGFVDSVLFELYSKIQASKIQINVQRSDILLPKVAIDVEKMHEAIQNLLDNAIKYTRTGGRLDINYKVESDFVLISIKDSGIGIPKDQQYKIFSKFYRATNAQKMQTDGSGLGLFIVKGIIEGHGGKIWFESVDGVGTTFYVTIPIAR